MGSDSSTTKDAMITVVKRKPAKAEVTIFQKGGRRTKSRHREHNAGEISSRWSPATWMSISVDIPASETSEPESVQSAQSAEMTERVQRLNVRSDQTPGEGTSGGGEDASIRSMKFEFE
ncbi:hypothetical protein BGZ94_009513 [Podila epigama]|nr:hypothetical protein BGZ94_009513 [Podila epigama]